MSEQVRETTNDLVDLIELVIKAIVGIVVVYLVAKALLPLIVGSGPTADIISGILGIVLFFVVIVSKRVRNEILSFGKNK